MQDASDGKAPIEVWILPGLDGTSTLHDEFAAELGAEGLACRSIPYPPDKALDYAQLAQLVRTKLPSDRPYVLLGESFSGPVAILLGASAPSGLAGLVLSTTFAKTPLSFLHWTARLTQLAPARLPAPLISWFLLGRWGSRALVGKVQAAIASVHPDVVRSRAATAMRADVSASLAAITTPTLVLNAQNDRLLALNSPTALSARLRNVAQVELEGPHLLLQAQPRACAQAIAHFVRSIAT